MAYNLIDESWIPVRCASGTRRWIPPWRISDRTDPPLRVDTGRPDFDGSLLQFLIGLMQTTSAPADNRALRKMLESPTAPEKLRERFEVVRYAFDLDGDGPRFMQDLTLEAEKSKCVAINALLVDTPGESGHDHFVKRDHVRRLSKAAVAAALYTAQTNGKPPGSGHRTGIRKNGPLTTLIAGATLFESVAANVLTRVNFANVPGRHDLDIDSSFPWLKPTPTSEDGRSIGPGTTAALEHYWAMPLRLRAVFRDLREGCDLFADHEAAAVQVLRLKHGKNYDDGFLHPLTPYTLMRGKAPRPIDGAAHSFQFRDWHRLVFDSSDSRIAMVISQYVDVYPDRDAKVQIFGYENKNANAIGYRWRTTLLPAASDRDSRELITTEAAQRANAAAYALSKLVWQLRRAWYGDQSRRKNAMAQLDSEFWSRAESGFFNSVSDAINAISSGADRLGGREAWLGTLHEFTLAIFDEYSGTRGAATARTLRRIALARGDLGRSTHPNNKELRASGGLSPLQETRRR